MELHLISHSSRSGAPVSCDKSLSVPTRIQELPDWRLWGEEITPLRDRVMIERLFSNPTVYAELLNMTKAIDQELHRCDPSTQPPESDTDALRPVVCVSVSCLRGTQVSPSFVEKLYEMYSRKPPVDDLVVKRKHTNSIFKTWWLSKDKEYTWQRSVLATKYLHSVQELANNRLWSSFPMHLLDAIEDGFKRDPFDTNLEVAYSRHAGKYVLNFETGEMYSTHDKTAYRIRCIVSRFDDFLECSILTGTTYKPFAKKYNAAGILFYSAHPVTGEPVFLLGRMTYGCESWCDFGGIKSFREYARHTAARECFEETLGIMGTSQALCMVLEDYKTNNVFKVVNQNMAYVSHFVRIPYDDYPSNFKRALIDAYVRDDSDVCIEVDEIRWFSLSSLRKALKLFQRLRSTGLANPIFENGEVDTLTSCNLRNEFVQTLCMAEKLKFLDSIKHICAQIHKQNKSQGKSESQDQSSGHVQQSRSAESHEQQGQQNESLGSQGQQTKSQDESSGQQTYRSTSSDSQEQPSQQSKSPDSQNEQGRPMGKKDQPLHGGQDSQADGSSGAETCSSEEVETFGTELRAELKEGCAGHGVEEGTGASSLCTENGLPEATLVKEKSSCGPVNVLSCSHKAGAVLMFGMGAGKMLYR